MSSFPQRFSLCCFEKVCLARRTSRLRLAFACQKKFGIANNGFGGKLFNYLSFISIYVLQYNH
jgi:hypothetical protein